MMNLTRFTYWPAYALAALIVAIAPPATADVGYEVGTTYGYTDNLLNDSSGLEDNYTSPRATVNFYPVSSMEISVNGQHTCYWKIGGLSSFLGGLQATFIPTRQRSRTSVYLSGGVNRRWYSGADYEKYNTNSIDATASVSHKVANTVQFRLGLMFNSTDYAESQPGDSVIEEKRSLDVFCGTNFSVFEHNSLDVELGFTDADFDAAEADSALGTDQELRSFYVSPRLSRPLGDRTGFNMTFTHRWFVKGGDAEVHGASTGFLSPWAQVYEGQTLTARVKSYLIPGVITTTGIGYWDKTYLKTIEIVDGLPEAQERNDEQKRVYITVQRPIVSKSGPFIEPTLSIDFTSNSSSVPVYDYDGVTVSGGVTIRM